jgi:phospholipase C
MSGSARTGVACGGLAAAAVLLCALCPPAGAEIPQIQHVVVVVQENRTPDNMFHGLQKYLPLADIADEGVDSTGATIRLTRQELATRYDLDHSHAAFEEMYDNGQMDGADLIACLPPKGVTCPKLPNFKFVDPHQVAPYFFIAINYSFSNRMFSTQQGPNFPAHQFLLSGTSQIELNSQFFAAENPELSLRKYGAGCDAKPGQLVMLIGPDGTEDNAIYPCFEHPTLTDVLDRAGLSWRYYAPSPKREPEVASIWTAPNAIRHMCKPSGNPPVCAGPDWADKKVFLRPAEILTDIGMHRLRKVSWVIPNGRASDHPRHNRGFGPSWVASVVNAIGESSYWTDTAILITWDD